MRRPLLWVLAVLCLFSFLACNPGEKSAAPGAAPAASPSFSSSGSVGVSECDDYIQAYRRCLSDKIPEADRATFEAGLNASIDSWKQAAMTPEGKAGLAAACQEARDTTKNSLQAYGCSF
jgi:hypothetical protein